MSSETVVQACLDRIDEVNGDLNAVFQIQSEAALTRAREADAALARGDVWGELHGVPMTIKDSLDTAGVVSTGGTQGRADFVPERDATVVSRLRNQGAILLGKTNTPEFGLLGATENRLGDHCRNPWDTSRTTGGSSGGSAAAIAAGLAPLSTGSDSAGSISRPARSSVSGWRARSASLSVRWLWWDTRLPAARNGSSPRLGVTSGDRGWQISFDQ